MFSSITISSTHPPYSQTKTFLPSAFPLAIARKKLYAHKLRCASRKHNGLPLGFFELPSPIKILSKSSEGNADVTGNLLKSLAI